MVVSDLRRTGRLNDNNDGGLVSDQPPAGWHTDPEDPSQYRYWDGQAWTDQRAPKQSDAAAPSGGEPPTEPAAKPWWKKWWGIALIVLFVLAIFGSLGDDESSDDGAPAATDTATSPADVEEEEAEEDVEAIETETAEPTETPEAAAEPESFEDRVAVALGDSNRDVEPRFTVEENTADDGGLERIVKWAINDNLTENMIKTSAKIDAKRILQVVAESPDLEYDQIFLIGTFSMVDQLGNAEEKDVIMATYPRATVEAINFENFLHDNVWNIANQDSLFIHPAFRED